MGTVFLLLFLCLPELRLAVADHLNTHNEEYRSFLSSAAEKKMSTHVKNLKKSGYWDCDLSDCLPLVIANFCQIPLTLFTSLKKVMIIRPSIVRDPVVRTLNQRINVAYICIPGREHFDAVVTLRKQTDDYFISDKNEGELQSPHPSSQLPPEVFSSSVCKVNGNPPLSAVHADKEGLEDVIASSTPNPTDPNIDFHKDIPDIWDVIEEETPSSSPCK